MSKKDGQKTKIQIGTVTTVYGMGQAATPTIILWLAQTSTSSTKMLKSTSTLKFWTYSLMTKCAVSSISKTWPSSSKKEIARSRPTSWWGRVRFSRKSWRRPSRQSSNWLKLSSAVLRTHSIARHSKLSSTELVKSSSSCKTCLTCNRLSLRDSSQIMVLYNCKSPSRRSLASIKCKLSRERTWSRYSLCRISQATSTLTLTEWFRSSKMS